MKIIKKSTLKPDVKELIQKLGFNDKEIEVNGKRKKKKQKNHASKNKTKNDTDIPQDTTKNKDGKAISDQKLKQLLIKPGTVWFEKTLDVECPADERSTPQELTKWRDEASKLFAIEISSYKKFLKFRKEKSDFAWAQTVLKSGTISDKMAAHVMLVQDSPVHTLDSISTLCTMVNTKGKRECILAIDNLKDLFVSSLLVKDRKLKSFEMRPLSKLRELCSGNQETRNRTLLLWYFEDLLKQKYFHFLELLEAVMHDSVEKTKLKSINIMSELLIANSEEEQFLLSKVVNKIGDPVNKVSGGVIHFLNKIVDSHPNIKKVVVDEVERLLFRLNIGPRTQYYCLCFLNQLILSLEDDTLASHLIRLYFAFFKVCVKKGEVDSKMMSALLSGTSRAFPFAKTKREAIIEHLDTLFKVLHLVNLNVSIQTLMLIFQGLDAGEGPTDRFYTALYKTIIDPNLAVTSRQTMFLNLMFKAIKKDPVDRRVKAFLKRLLQVCHYLPPPLVCGILFLISEVIKLKPALLSFQQQNLYLDGVDDLNDEDEHYHDVPLEEDENESKSNEEPSKSEETVEKNEDDESKFKSSSWIHIKDKRKSTTTIGYDPVYWNPLHCGADTTAFWELCALKEHYHPSVCSFLNNIIKKESIDYSGDPLQDFTLLRFLERFVYRNPKQQSSAVTQDLHHRVFGKRKLYVSGGARSIPVASKNYIFQQEEKIPVEEMFLFHYLQKQEQKKDKKKRKRTDDDESVNSEDFEQLLDKLEPGSWDKIDFATGMQKQAKEGKKKKSKQMDEEDEDDEDDNLDNEEDDFDENDMANDEEFKKAFDEYDEELDNLEDAEFEDGGTDEDGDFIDAPKRKKKSKDFDPSNMFASAEEFADMLEDNANDKNATITSSALVNKDKSDARQIAWETSRDQFVRGAHWKDKKGKRSQKSSGFKGKNNRKGNFKKR